MLFTGLEVCVYNINRRQKNLTSYEFGKVYAKWDDRYNEKEVLALYMRRNMEKEKWRHQTVALTFYDLAQQVSHILYRTGIDGVQQEEISDQLFEYAITLRLKNEPLAKLGKVKGSLTRDFGIKQDLFYAELDTSLLFREANPKLVIREVPKFPEVKRDLSLVLDAPVRFDEIRRLVMDTEKRLIKNIVAFDVYEGENIPKGKKAYALSFTLLDEAKTLTDQEIDSTMDRLIRAFEEKLGAIIRK